ncbi:hypothetical protein UF75_4120 [Desulfosporosinus sp. I2]|nr:hypothetical protein UF75_4120 [Desulfosporosinus sp. I2]
MFLIKNHPSILTFDYDKVCFIQLFVKADYFLGVGKNFL